MHIPDGLMDPTVALAGWIIAIVFIAISVKITKKTLDKKTIPTMALLAAGLFAAQMLNFPIGGGTSGHLLGAALAAYVLGPWAGMLVMVSVILIQALLFGDGGITAMGLNIFNMAIIGSLLGGYLPKLVPKKFGIIALAITSWASVFIGSLFCAAELSMSYSISGGVFGISPIIAFPAMTIYHVIIGIGEAVISVGVVVYIEKVAPEMLNMRSRISQRVVPE